MKFPSSQMTPVCVCQFGTILANTPSQCIRKELNTKAISNSSSVCHPAGTQQQFTEELLDFLPLSESLL